MEISTQTITFETKGYTDIVDITDKVQKVVNASGLSEGQVTIFGIGSTTGISTIEFEPGLVHTDLAEMFEKFAPYRVNYAHNQTWGDDNGAAHLRSTLTGSSLVVPFLEGNLLLGTWQQIVFIDYDTRARSRKVVVQVIGK
jgi:secondary thiamine-phosphate synthase enzyme